MLAQLNLPGGTLAWIIAVSVAVVVFIVARLLLSLGRRAKVRAEAPATSVRRLIHSLFMGTLLTTILLITGVAGAIAYSSVAQPDPDTLALIWAWVWKVSVVLLAVQLVAWTGAILDWLIAWYLKRQAGPSGTPDPSVAGAMSTFRWMGLLLVYAAIFLLALDNLGVDVTALIAGLGVGGIAIALAVQNILGDLFASLTITLDKPFVVGDFIVVGKELGTIEKIGLKTTRVRSLGGEQLVFGNNDLLTSRIQNYKRMNERRVVFGFRVTYDTTPEQILAIDREVKRIIVEHDNSRFDRCHLARFGEFSLEFEVVYYVLSADYNVYMDTQQDLNLAIMRLLDDLGVRFALPTQTLHLTRAREDGARDSAPDESP